MSAPTLAVVDAALEAHQHGAVPLPLEPGTKRPTSPSWQATAYASDGAVRASFATGCGLGLRLGGGLVDVDLDTEHARRAARLLLPSTPVRSGRPSAPASHWWFRVSDGAEHYRKHCASGGESVVELRATPGHQTAVPPSLHPSGEALVWEGPERPWDAPEHTLEELRAAVAAVAVVAILVPCWPGEGLRHDAFLALAGGLLRGCQRDSKAVAWAERVVGALATLTGDEESDARVRECVPSSVKRLDEGGQARGWTSLAAHLSDPEAVKHARAAWTELLDALGIVVAADGTPDAGALDDAVEAAFWDSRPVLSAVRDFARARRVGPWALLGAVLAEVAVRVPPTVVLPPTRGSIASLNVFVALAGESGGGKSAAMDAAREFLLVDGASAVPDESLHRTSPGSGEGLLAAFVDERNAKGQLQRAAYVSVLLAADEVQALGALAGRTNSTLLPFLKSAWSGRPLATQNAEVARNRRVEGHAYRLAVVAGVQPHHAGAILDDADGGFPQRWLWLPTYDPHMVPAGQRFAPSARPWRWRVPSMGPSDLLRPRTVLELPVEAVEAVLSAADAANRPLGAPAPAGAALDGHALLTRCKVAALLALLDGRCPTITAEDWELAGVVLAVSDRTRDEVVRVRMTAAAREEDRRATRAGRSAAIAADVQAETQRQRCVAAVLAALGKADGQWVTRGALSRQITPRNRDQLDDALDLLTETGQVVSEERTANNGAVGCYLRLAVAS